MAEISGWRVNDVVAYDVMRESAAILTALLIDEANFGAASLDSATAEIAHWRCAVETVDGFDRGEVVALAARIRDRIGALSGATP